MLLRSMEGTPSDDFPPSPPLQQMHLQEINGTPVLLAVGMAGRGHWSASILMSKMKPNDAENSGLNSLVFQYAVNLRNNEGWAGCKWMAGETFRYHSGSLFQKTQLSGGGFLEMLCQDIRFRIRPFGLVGCELIQEPSGNGPQILAAVPTEKNKSARPIQWEMEIVAFPIANEMRKTGFGSTTV